MNKKTSITTTKKFSLMERLKKNSRIEGTDVMTTSAFFKGRKSVATDIPMLNVALSGTIDEGITSGLTVLAGPSKHFKTSFALCMVKAYLDKHKDAVLLFYDTEFGSPQSYFKTFGIDTDRVLHTPIKNIEELKFDLVNQLEQFDKKDKVIIVIDSIGNVASKKELDDALSESSKADMSRAKALKGLFRMITPYLKMKDIPLFAINHIYMEQGLFPKAIVSGGTGIYYSADNIWIIGRQKDSKGTDLLGYNFIIRIEKSRFVREGSKIPINVTFEGGIQRWSGLLDVAMELGYVIKPKVGWYQAINPALPETDPNYNLGKCVREKDTLEGVFWQDVFAKTTFAAAISKRYMLVEA